MKTIQMFTLTTCILLLTGAADAQTVTVQNTLDYRNNDCLGGTWFAEADAILDHFPYCRGSNQDWGWTHNVADSIPDGATGIQSASVTIISWKIDVENGEDDVIYVLPEEPDLASSIVRTGTELGLLQSYLESPISVSWGSNGQVYDYANLWSVTTFDLPAETIEDLWTHGKLYFHVDIDQTGDDGLRGTIKNSVLRINYFAPEPETPPTAAVYRFWSPLTSAHFYTINENEANLLITQYAYAWIYEGIAYNTLIEDTQPNAVPVYRFWSAALGGHFYTIDEAEANNLADNWAEVWTYEGVAFYAYPEGSQPAGTSPIYRFWSNLLGHHFYTMNEAEAQMLLDQYSWVWTYEGVAWYAFMP